MIIAHRGLWNHQNKIDGIIKAATYTDIVEVDVRVNSRGVTVLCHDRDDVDDDNDTLEDLCKVQKPLHILLDIKGNYAKEVLKTIKSSPHIWKLSSYDYRCVNDLLKWSGYEIGIITEGAPSEEILKLVDFVTQDYEFIDDTMLETYRKYNLEVYVFNTHKDILGVDGMIKNIFIDNSYT